MAREAQDIYGIEGSVPNVSAQGGGGTPFGVRASAEDFGGQVGAATEKLGAAGEEAATQWNGLIAETQSNQSELNYIKAQGELKAKYTQYEGLQAEQMRPKYEEESLALQQQYRESLSPIAGKMFDSNTRRTLANDLSEYAGYAAAQVKQASLKSNDDLASLQAQSAGNLPTVLDDQRFGGLLGNTLHAANAVADIKGWGAYSTGIGADGRMTFSDTPEGQNSKAQYEAYANSKLAAVYLTAAKTVADNHGAVAAGTWAEKHWDSMPDAAKVELNQYLAPKMTNEAISQSISTADNEIVDKGWGDSQLSNIPKSPVGTGGESPDLLGVIHKNEGFSGRVGRDSNGANVLNGVNEKAFPQDYAAIKTAYATSKAAGDKATDDFYQKNIIDKYNIKSLPVATQAIVADAIVNQGEFGKSLIPLAKDGASPQELIDMRRNHYQQLADSDTDGSKGYAVSLKGWNNRLDSLENQRSGAQYANKADYLEANKDNFMNMVTQQITQQYPDYYTQSLAERRAESHYNHLISQAQGELKSDRDTITNAIGGSFTKGQPVTTYAQLASLPGMQPILDRVGREQGGFYKGIDTMIAKAAHGDASANSPNAYDAIQGVLNPPSNSTRGGQIDFLAKGLGSQNPGISISQKDYNDAKPAIDLSDNIKRTITNTMKQIKDANGNVDGKGEQRAVQWYNTVMAAYKQNAALGDKKKSDTEFMQSLGEQYGPNPPSRMQQITSWAESLFKSHPTNTASSTIRVVSPDGKTGNIPAAQLDEAIKAGYTRAQ